MIVVQVLAVGLIAFLLALILAFIAQWITDAEDRTATYLRPADEWDDAHRTTWEKQ